MSILALDFGGTRTRAGWFIANHPSPEPTLIQRAETLTRATDPRDQVIDRLIALARQVIPPGATPRAIGISAPGPNNAAAGMIYHSYALPGWENVPLGQMLSDALGAPVYLENDGNMGALAEYTGGAGRGCDPMLYMTISTGIGGGVILGGQLFTGWSGLAAEPGHLLVMSHEGEYVRLEAVASGTALGQTAQRLLSTTDTPSVLRDSSAGDSRVIDGAAVGRAAQAGDPLALSIIQSAGEHLGVGIVTLLHLFSPQAIVVGGSVSRLGDLLFEPARSVIAEKVLDPLFIPPNLIRPAHYGDDVCLIGAAMHAIRQSVLRDSAPHQ
jgi:glucokinase